MEMGDGRWRDEREEAPGGIHYTLYLVLLLVLVLASKLR